MEVDRNRDTGPREPAMILRLFTSPALSPALFLAKSGLHNELQWVKKAISKKQKIVVPMRLELMTLELLAPRSNLLS
jgi:hypothetical protein